MFTTTGPGDAVRRGIETRCGLRAAACACALALGLSMPAQAARQAGGSIEGKILDTLGARVTGMLTLYREGAEVEATDSEVDGTYRFSGLEPGRYLVEVTANGFAPSQSQPVYVGSSGRTRVDLTMQIGPLEQEVSVTAAARETPIAQIGAPVSVISRDLIDTLGKSDVMEALRTVPGLSIAQAGQRGGTTSIFIRGGESDFNKVLIDGAPANDIGGAFSFDALSTSAVERIEVMRAANSVLYGSDAMSGVISLETRRGHTEVPEVTYSIDGGNFRTIRNEISLGGTLDRFDYFLDASRYDTDNDAPHNKYRNDTLAGRFGVVLGGTTDISTTFRRAETDYDSPNAILYYGLPDDANSRTRLTYATINGTSQWTERVRTTLRYAYMERDAVFTNPTPTGTAFDPFGFGANYLGNDVTITGENGFSVTGQAILDFGGVYPSISESNTKRHLFSAQADVDLVPALAFSVGGRVEDEAGESTFSSRAHRRNYGAFVEGRAGVGPRLYVNGGVGLEDHAIFDREVVPRLSVAFYARQPRRFGVLGETKLFFTIGEGIKAPSILDEQSSLFSLLAAQSAGQTLIDQYAIEPIGAERTRGIDTGLEQGFWDSRARARISYFNNRNEDLIEYVSNTVLPALGVPQDVANASGFGATLNSASFDAQGLDLSGDAALGTQLRISGWYTFLDAQVTESFSGSALMPSINPAFPTIPIGQFSPLVGARPFRRPTHSGGVTLTWVNGPLQLSVTGNFVGHFDDSTFLSDGFFGTSLLLPNKNLSGNYQKVDVSAAYRVRPGIRWYASVENILDEDYAPVGGFPGLPIAFRTGVRVTAGGDGY